MSETEYITLVDKDYGIDVILRSGQKTYTFPVFTSLPDRVISEVFLYHLKEFLKRLDNSVPTMVQ